MIQLEIEAEEIGANVPTEVPLVGDAKAVMAQLNAYLDERPWQFDDASEWGASIRAETERKHDENVPRFASDESPMNYYRPLKEIEEALPRDAIVISEGENTMAIARQVIMSSHPRARLDAGTWGTMGVGPGFALAAQLVHPDRRVVALEGDSAFGFDATDVETAVRHRLPITWIVFNNNGIGRGTATLDPGRPVPPQRALAGQPLRANHRVVRRQGLLLRFARRVEGGPGGRLQAGGSHADPCGTGPEGGAAPAGVRLVEALARPLGPTGGFACLAGDAPETRRRERAVARCRRRGGPQRCGSGAPRRSRRAASFARRAEDAPDLWR